jgi:hypothetical protein
MVVLKVETVSSDENSGWGTIMSTKSNVIDMTARRKAQLKAEARGEKRERPAVLVEFGARKKEMMTQERRKNRRTILSNFLGAFVILPEKGLKEVTLYDLSEGGVGFDLEATSGAFRIDEELAMRVYISKEIYVPFQVRVKNVREVKAENIFRHGTVLTSMGQGDEVMKSFVKFVESLSAHFKTDKGDFKLPNHKG